jgi:hypothetical protein
MEKRKDIRLNKDYRTAYIKDFRRFLESKNDNPKYEAFLSAKTLCKTRIADAFKLATKVVHRVYKPEDVSTLQGLQKKYNTVDATAKDSCFYFAVVDSKGKQVKELDKYNDEVDKEKHFNFELDGSLVGREHSSDNSFAYAWYREELKANGYNPDIEIEQKDNRSNPHHSTNTNLNSNWLKGNDGSSTDFYQVWKDSYALDIIGSGGCRSRAIPCTEQEFATFELMLIAKANVVKTHQDWIGSILRAVDLVGEQIKAMKTKSEVDLLAKEYNWEPQISLNKVFGSALVVNPASVKSMTDSILGYERKPSKEEKIANAKIALQKHLESQQVA